MTGPTQRCRRAPWLALGLSMLLVTACDDKASESTDDAEHGDHGHDEDSEHKHGGSSDSADKAGSRAGQGGASERTDASKSESAKAGAEGKSSTAGKSGAGAGGKPAQPDAESEADGGSDDPGGERRDVVIRFKAKLGDRAFACGTTYEMQGTPGETVTPQDLRLFIQDLALVKEDGTRVPITNAVRAPWQSETVALLDFEDATGNCAGTPETNAEITGTVAAGTYKGLSFANGVPEALNHADATTQADPLKSSASLSWSWLNGFRFAKVELVKTDTESFGEGVFHPGSLACTGNPTAGQVSCSKPNRNTVSIEQFDANKDSVVIDVAELFAETDLSMDSACHSGEKAVCESMFNAWGINFADGQPKAGQTVFKKE